MGLGVNEGLERETREKRGNTEDEGEKKEERTGLGKSWGQDWKGPGERIIELAEETGGGLSEEDG